MGDNDQRGAVSAPNDDEDSSVEGLERRAEQSREGQDTISFEEYRERRDEK